MVVEPDEDFDGNSSGWHAYCPVLEKHGASTWGATKVEALKNIDSLIHMVVESMREYGEAIPEEPITGPPHSLPQIPSETHSAQTPHLAQ